MTRAEKVAVVTGGLIATGAVVGALCGVVALALGLAVHDTIGARSDPTPYLLAAVVGGFVGTTILPLLGWGLLRHVPIGRAIAQCALGTILGGFIVFAVQSTDPVFSPTLGAFCGFLASAARLRIVTRIGSSPRYGLSRMPGSG